MTLSRKEGVAILRSAKAKLAEVQTKEDSFKILKDAGKAVGYTPAFRCLIMGLTPDESIRW